MPLIGDTGFVRRFIVLSAPQRSGTTALQSALSSSPDIDTFFEIFHAEQFNVPSNFFCFLKRHAWAQHLFITPKAENMETLFLRYLRYLSGLKSGRRLIIDVKDNSLHNLDAVWHEPGSPPFLVRLLQKYKIPVLRIQRRNIFLQVISTQLASHHKKYHFKHDEEVPELKVTLKPDSIHRAIVARSKANARVDAYLAGIGRCCRLDYEDIFVDNRLAPEVLPALAGLFGAEVAEIAAYESPFQKINTDPLGRISNSDEVLSYFSSTPYADMVRQALGVSTPDLQTNSA